MRTNLNYVRVQCHTALRLILRLSLNSIHPLILIYNTQIWVPVSLLITFQIHRSDDDNELHEVSPSPL